MYIIISDFIDDDDVIDDAITTIPNPTVGVASVVGVARVGRGLEITWQLSTNQNLYCSIRLILHYCCYSNETRAPVANSPNIHCVS